MKILMINVVCGIRSTGRICTDLAQQLEKQGHEVKIAYGRGNVPEQFEKFAIKIGDDNDVKVHGIMSRLFDNSGFNSKKITEKFIIWIKKYNPDVIHLHNIHGYYLNVEILFDYLKTCNKKIIWTLHDCWAFTGHCSYFDYVGCDKWKVDCKGCIQKKEYPKCIGFSNSKNNYVLKKKLFSGVPNLTIVTPSKWLAKLVKESFLKEYPVVVINNGINLEIFRKRSSLIKKKYNLSNEKIVLGVAAIWNNRKGLKYMIDLASILDDTFKVVVIGIDKNQKDSLPSNMIGILKTDSTEELAEWYSAAYVFVNPTLEDNYPTTNLEAIACGTPVITFNTGGSVESASLYGITAKEKNTKSLYEIIINDQKIESLKITCCKEELSIKHMIDQYLNLFFDDITKVKLWEKD